MSDKFIEGIDIRISDEEMLEAAKTVQRYCIQHGGCRKCLNIKNCEFKPYWWRFENEELQSTAQK